MGLCRRNLHSFRVDSHHCVPLITDVNFGRADKAEATYESYQEPIGDGLLIVYVKAMFSATQRCNIVATLFRMVTTLFQRCSAVLR